MASARGAQPDAPRQLGGVVEEDTRGRPVRLVGGQVAVSCGRLENLPEHPPPSARGQPERLWRALRSEGNTNALRALAPSPRPCSQAITPQPAPRPPLEPQAQRT